VDDIQTLRRELQWCQTYRRIHQRDAIEIEELLRITALPNLSRRPGREAHLSNLLGTTISEALYVVAALEEAIAAVPGDICEFGVAQGTTSTLIASEIMATDRKLYLFDSFEGLPAPSKEDVLIDDIFNLGSMEAYQGKMRCREDEVLGRLKTLGFPANRTELRKGWVNETLARPDAPKKVAFAYLDFDFYEPLRDGLAYIDQHMDVGGRVVVDDYGFFSAGAQLATDEFVAATDGRWKLDLPLSFAGKFALLEKVG
jgi:hypothetical protein